MLIFRKSVNKKGCDVKQFQWNGNDGSNQSKISQQDIFCIIHDYSMKYNNKNKIEYI